MSKLTIKRPERVVDLCLDASLQAEWEDASRRLTEARKAVPADARLNSRRGAEAIAAEVRQLEERMRADVVQFRLRALPRSEWARIFAAHPPRDGEAADRAFGAHQEAFFEDVIPASIVAVTRHGEPVEFDPAIEWEALANEMTDRQYADFATVVFELNRGQVSVPFSRAASSLTQDSSGTSEQRASEA